MSLRTTTTGEKLAEVEQMIREEIRGGGRRVDVLKAIAADLRARLNGAPSVALVDIERRVVTVARSKGLTGYSPAALHTLGEGVAVHWAIIKQALELFGAEASQ